ncbi:MAG: hypothetical protein H6736_00085 [Alphaproteobacteria bacterium]|nr:hypothetical protein [Alphaproteobacteria bacterium]MCB9690190.1 hypothetical protein [Alphaproteobacteria bacterium]
MISWPSWMMSRGVALAASLGVGALGMVSAAALASGSVRPAPEPTQMEATQAASLSESPPAHGEEQRHGSCHGRHDRQRDAQEPRHGHGRHRGDHHHHPDGHHPG